MPRAVLDSTVLISAFLAQRGVSVAVVIHDPNDDMMVASAQRAQVAYIVARDKDLLSLQGTGSV